MNTTGNTTATRLATILGEQGRKKGWLADRMGVSPYTVSHWLSGERHIPTRYIRPLAALLGISPLDLLPEVATDDEGARHE